MAGKRVETPVTLTNDISKILKSFKDIGLSGDCDFITACNIAMLVLKHRQNKTQKQRILMFVASPIKHKHDDLVLLGKKLKKNNVAIDIISYGNTDTNKEAVNLLINTANNNNNSHLMEVEADQFIIDCLFTSPILAEEMFEEQPNQNVNPVNSNVNAPPQEGGQQPSNFGGMGGLSQFERDINLAIQQSREEEERRKKAAEQVVSGGEVANKEDNENKDSQPKENKDNKMDVEEEGEDEDLAAELEKAKLLSIKEHEESLKKEKEKQKNMKEDIMNDDTFMQELLGEVGIDQSEINDKKDEENESLVKKENKNKDKKDEKKKDNDDEDEKLIKK